MSINGAAYIAFSGLSAAQTQMTIASANIANAGTAGYTEKTGNQSTSVTGGVGTGVTVSSVTSNVDQYLMKELVSSISDLGSANNVNNYLNELQQLYGSTGNDTTAGTSLGNTLASLESSLSALAASPGDANAQQNFVQSLENVTSQLQQTSSGIQQLRSNADKQIGTTVNDVNQNLQLIGSLNTQIVQAQAMGQPTGDLEDQRNTALQAVAKDMGVSYFTSSNGSMQVYTSSGETLVNNSTVSTVSYTPSAQVSASTTYSATPPSGFQGIMVNGTDITQQVTTGEIGGLLQLRDSTLPGAQSQLDQLASQLVSTVNAIHNQGTSLPPPSSVTSANTVTAATPFSGTGTVRLAETDSKGNLVSYQDIDLSGITTVGGLVTAINSGGSGLTASINANGNLVITAPSGNGVAMNEMTSSVGASNQGFSDYFGLNNLMTGTNAGDIGIRSDILKNPGALATSTLSSAASLTASSSVLSPGDATLSNNLYTALTQGTTFPATAGIGQTTTSFADYAASIVASVATQSSQASDTFTNKQTIQSSFSNTMSSESGVNLDQETAQMSTLQNEYTASAELLQVINQMFSALMTSVQTAAG
jgi:flagellar hook-associated protein 1 FlgK